MLICLLLCAAAVSPTVLSDQVKVQNAHLPEGKVHELVRRDAPPSYLAPSRFPYLLGRSDDFVPAQIMRDYERRGRDSIGGSYLSKSTTLDSIGGGHLLKRDILDSIGGGHLLKRDMLDSIGGGNLLKRDMLDSIGGGNLLKRTLDSIGGGHLIKRNPYYYISNEPNEDFEPLE